MEALKFMRHQKLKQWGFCRQQRSKERSAWSKHTYMFYKRKKKKRHKTYLLLYSPCLDIKYNREAQCVHLPEHFLIKTILLPHFFQLSLIRVLSFYLWLKMLILFCIQKKRCKQEILVNTKIRLSQRSLVRISYMQNMKI